MYTFHKCDILEKKKIAFFSFEEAFFKSHKTTFTKCIQKE